MVLTVKYKNVHPLMTQTQFLGENCFAMALSFYRLHLKCMAFGKR